MSNDGGASHMDLTSEEDLFGNLNSDPEDNAENTQNSANVSSVSQDSLFARPQKRKKAKLFNNSVRTEDPNFSKLLDCSSDLPARKLRSRVLTQQTLESEVDVNFSYAFQSSQESSPEVPAKKKQALIFNCRSQKSDESASEGNFSQAFGSSQESVFRLPARKKKGVFNHSSKVELELDVNFSKAFSSSTPDVRTRKPQALVFDQLSQGSSDTPDDANFSKAFAEHDVTSEVPAETKRALVFNQSQDSETETNFSKVFDPQNSSIASLTRRKQALLFEQSQRKSDNSEIAEVNFSIALSSSQSSTSAPEEVRKQKALVFNEHHPDVSETNVNFSGALLSMHKASLNLPERKKQAMVFNESHKPDIEEMESNFSRVFSLPQVVSSSVEQPQDLEESQKTNETEIEEVDANLAKTLSSSQYSSTDVIVVGNTLLKSASASALCDSTSASTLCNSGVESFSIAETPTLDQLQMANYTSTEIDVSNTCASASRDRLESKIEELEVSVNSFSVAERLPLDQSQKTNYTPAEIDVSNACALPSQDHESEIEELEVNLSRTLVSSQQYSPDVTMVSDLRKNVSVESAALQNFGSDTYTTVENSAAVEEIEVHLSRTQLSTEQYTRNGSSLNSLIRSTFVETLEVRDTFVNSSAAEVQPLPLDESQKPDDTHANSPPAKETHLSTTGSRVLTPDQQKSNNTYVVSGPTIEAHTSVVEVHVTTPDRSHKPHDSYVSSPAPTEAHSPAVENQTSIPDQMRKTNDTHVETNVSNHCPSPAEQPREMPAGKKSVTFVDSPHHRHSDAFPAEETGDVSTKDTQSVLEMDSSLQKSTTVESSALGSSGVDSSSAMEIQSSAMETHSSAVKTSSSPMETHVSVELETVPPDQSQAPNDTSAPTRISNVCTPLGDVPTLPDTNKDVSVVNTHQRSSDEFQAEDADHGPMECASSAGEIDPSLTRNKNSTTLRRSPRISTMLESTATRSSVSQSIASAEESRRPSTTISSGSRSTTIISKSKIGITFSAEDSVSECEKSPKRKAPRKQNSARNADIRSKPDFPQFQLYCNTRFYNYLISKIEPDYGIYTNREVVKLVKFISEIAEEITHMKENHNEKVKILKETLFDYKVVVTHFDFISFCMNYFPIRFRCKAVPMTQTCGKPPNVYYDPSTLFLPIKSE